jgi:hypothetical protein
MGNSVYAHVQQSNCDCIPFIFQLCDFARYFETNPHFTPGLDAHQIRL